MQLCGTRTAYSSEHMTSSLVFNWLLITQYEDLCVFLCGPLFVFVRLFVFTFDHCTNITKAFTIFWLIKCNVKKNLSNAFMNMRDSICFKGRCQPSRMDIIEVQYNKNNIASFHVIYSWIDKIRPIEFSPRTKVFFIGCFWCK